MPHVLVVDDSEIDRLIAVRLLQKLEGFQVTQAAHGRDALASVKQSPPDVIVSDLQMPEMNGLELVEAIRRDYPSIPVVLMTHVGSEDIAAEALCRGAAGYVPKRSLGEQLCESVERILEAVTADRGHSRLMHSLEEAHCRFWLRNDPELIDPLVAHVQNLLRCVPLGDEAERLRVGVAVKHALWIAHCHGNLEVPLNDDCDDQKFQKLIRDRRSLPPYNQRSVEVTVRVSPLEATISVRHEGPGIDISVLPAQLTTAAASNSWLSGFLLMPSIMHEVRYEDSGRTLHLRHEASVVGEPELECV